MKDKLKAALDQALANQINHLFGMFVSNISIHDDDVVVDDGEIMKEFNRGMSITMVAYGRACLVIDRMTEV